MIKLTARQEQILNLIKDAIENTGFPPTRAEIATELGFRSANAAEEHLQALARKGAIEISPGTSRGIRLLNMGLARNVERAAPRFHGKQMTLPHDTLAQLSLPLIGRVAAGSPILAQEHVEATYNVDVSLFGAKPDFLLKVRGMSMRDAGIFDGDLLAVKKSDTAKNGQIIVARIGDDVTVKRYKKTGSMIELLPENPDFKPIRVIPEQDDFALEGLAVGLVRSWS
jgi:repressor LexA